MSHSHSRTVCITVWRPSVSSFLRFLGTVCVPLPIIQGLHCKYLDGVKSKARPPTWGWSTGDWAKGVLWIQKVVLSQEFTEGDYFCWVRFSSFIQEIEDRMGWWGWAAKQDGCGYGIAGRRALFFFLLTSCYPTIAAINWVLTLCCVLYVCYLI